MKRIFNVITSAAAALVFLGCDTGSPLLPETELLVVRAYLYASEPVTDVRLTSTFELGVDTTAGQPINDASIVIEKNGNSFALVASPGDSGYYHYPGNDLSVEIGDTFRITVEQDGQIVTAETVIPPAPEDVTVSTQNYYIDTSTFRGFRGDTSSVTIRWNNDEGTFFFVDVENIEANPVPINEQFAGFIARFRSFRSAPTQNDNYVLRRFDLTFFGEHRVVVYKVNDEYANLFSFGTQDSRNLNEPLTNIKNGLGIFAGFSSKAVTFRVQAQ